MTYQVNQYRIDEEVANFKRRAASAEKMNPEVKKAFVEALRSGEYSQTQSYLHLTKDHADTPSGYCCLGVLSELAEREGVVTSTTNTNGIVEFRGKNRDFSSAFLIETVADWAGWEFESGIDSALMGINDNGGSFEMIADLVEEHL
jgi:hypothetical protein